MTRYSTSFTISILFHLFLALLLFFTYKTVASEIKVEEKRVKLSLCCVADTTPVIEKKPVEKIVTPKVPIPPKAIEKKIINKPVKKQKNPIKKKIVEKKKAKVIKKIDIPVVKEKIKKTEPKIESKITKKSEVKESQELKKTQIVEPTKKIKEKVDIKKSKETNKQRVQTEYINENINKIVKLLRDNLYYPRSARKRGITGEVVVQFILSTDSNVYSIKVLSSNSDLLSRAAIKTIENLSGSFPKPSEELSLEIPIKYNLKR